MLVVCEPIRVWLGYSPLITTVCKPWSHSQQPKTRASRKESSNLHFSTVGAKDPNNKSHQSKSLESGGHLTQGSCLQTPITSTKGSASSGECLSATAPTALRLAALAVAGNTVYTLGHMVTCRLLTQLRNQRLGRAHNRHRNAKGAMQKSVQACTWLPRESRFSHHAKFCLLVHSTSYRMRACSNQILHMCATYMRNEAHRSHPLHCSQHCRAL